MAATTVRDVLIIGSGAGGGTLAFALARANFDVLVLEKGPRYTEADYRHDEIRRSTTADLFVPSVEEEPHVLVDAAAGNVRELTTLGWIANCVGGGTVHMGGSFYRFHPADFRLRSTFGEFEAIEDWPYSYDELEPYYSIAEHEVGVSGADSDHPFLGKRSRPYPMPPVATHALGRDVERACRGLGLHPCATPRAINSKAYDGRPACACCQLCAGYGCPVHARGSIQSTLLRKAEQTGHCEVRAGAMVRAITVDERDRATGCLYIDTSGQEHRVQARLVCVCASAVESARLLLLSSSKHWPDGLANRSGLVGRHLQFHIATGGRARVRDAQACQTSGSNRFLGVSILDHYFLPAGVSALPKGAILRFDVAQRGPVTSAQAIAYEGSDRPLWGSALKHRLIDYFTECCEIEFEAYQDFIPNDRTYMTLDAEVTDKWKLPVACLHVAPVDHHERAGRWLRDRGCEVFDAMGAIQSFPGGAGTINRVLVHGTCRAGHDPSRSVLNAFCQSHDIRNLFVVDGSFMPTCGGAPSTLTIVANSLRVADYVIDRARTGELT
jgi:choline dehydrogenase-like flavoprotein